MYNHAFRPDAWDRDQCSAKIEGINGRTETCNRPAAEHMPEERKRCPHTSASLCFICESEKEKQP
jgi:hypothetical protein